MNNQFNSIRFDSIHFDLMKLSSLQTFTFNKVDNYLATMKAINSINSSVDITIAVEISHIRDLERKILLVIMGYICIYYDKLQNMVFCKGSVIPYILGKNIACHVEYRFRYI